MAREEAEAAEEARLVTPRSIMVLATIPEDRAARILPHLKPEARGGKEATELPVMEPGTPTEPAEAAEEEPRETGPQTKAETGEPAMNSTPLTAAEEEPEEAQDQERRQEPTAGQVAFMEAAAAQAAFHRIIPQKAQAAPEAKES